MKINQNEAGALARKIRTEAINAERERVNRINDKIRERAKPRAKKTAEIMAAKSALIPQWFVELYFNYGAKKGLTAERIEADLMSEVAYDQVRRPKDVSQLRDEIILRAPGFNSFEAIAKGINVFE